MSKLSWLSLAACTALACGTSGAPDAGGSADTGPFCDVDSPCFTRVYRCQGATQYVPVVTHDCSWSCGAVACSGGSCDPSGPAVSCPSGTICQEWSSNEQQPGTPPCIAPDAGGPGDTGLFCYVDSPCFTRVFRCRGATEYVPVVTHDCAWSCGAVPCSGGSCDPSGPAVACPSGTTCQDWFSNEQQPSTPPCFAADAGVAADAGIDCTELMSSWKQAVLAMDRTCTQASDCLAPGDCDTSCSCVAALALGSSEAVASVAAYSGSTAAALETEFYRSCMATAPQVCDCGPAVVECVDSQCQITGRQCCGCPLPRDAGM